MSPSRPAFLALSAIRCLSASSCISCLIALPRATYFPFGLKWNLRPALSLGAPSKPPPKLSLLAALYGLIEGLGVTTGTGVGTGVGRFRVLALMEANLGCIGLYLSFLDWGAVGVESRRRGWAAIFKPAPCWVCSTGVPFFLPVWGMVCNRVSKIRGSFLFFLERDT